MADRLKRIRIVLVRTSHPGNIGAAARAMKTMGLDRLWLVEPRQFPHAEAYALAAGADDVLEAATVVPTLSEALAGCTLAYGCTARLRGVALPDHSPRDAAPALVAAAGDSEVALVFGNERTGLTNDELFQCQAAVHIDANPDYSSLNLAAAVQVLAYELRVAAQAGAPAVAAASRYEEGEDKADAAAMEGFFGHLEQALSAIDFFKGRAPHTLMRRLRRLFFRAEPSEREVLILRGILSDAERMARLAGRGD